MARNPSPNYAPLVVFILLSSPMLNFGKTIKSWGSTNPLPNDIFLQNFSTKLDFDPKSIQLASSDYGNIVHEKPYAVFHPSSIDDIISLIKFSNNCSTPFGISARGRGHSVRGQATAGGGVVVEMSSLSRNGVGISVGWDPLLEHYYADVGGEQLWVDVLRAAVEHGVAPVSWTDYLYLTVGGTLSNGGISGQSFRHGPQISSVLELDVITGKGEFMTCSHDMNSELFFAVLGGLGQFGIITRARIILHKAPSRVKWVRLLYDEFSKFTRDQEYLISNNGADYVEGSIITHYSSPNNWRSSYYSPSNLSKIASLLETNHNGLLYSIELVIYYHHQTTHKDVDALVKDLNFLPGYIFHKEVGFIDFLGRIKESKEEEEETHPWLNIFVPRSRILDFQAGVFSDIIARHNQTSGPILFYPFNRIKWDHRMSAVIPDEDIFYTLALLHKCGPHHNWAQFQKLNDEIIHFCERSGIKIKQYLPHYKSKEDWVQHFGPKWPTFVACKNKFDPRMILSPGQRIFSSHASYIDF